MVQTKEVEVGSSHVVVKVHDLSMAGVVRCPQLLRCSRVVEKGGPCPVCSSGPCSGVLWWGCPCLPLSGVPDQDARMDRACFLREGLRLGKFDDDRSPPFPASVILALSERQLGPSKEINALAALRTPHRNTHLNTRPFVIVCRGGINAEESASAGVSRPMSCRSAHMQPSYSYHPPRSG